MELNDLGIILKDIKTIVVENVVIILQVIYRDKLKKIMDCGIIVKKD